MFQKNTIKKRVFAAIEQRITNAEAEHLRLHEQADVKVEEEIKQLKEKHEADKIAITDKMVNDIVGTILSPANAK